MLLSDGSEGELDLQWLCPELRKANLLFMRSIRTIMIITHHNAVFVVDVVMRTHAKCTVQGYPQRLGSHWHPELAETRVVFGHFPLGHLVGELSFPPGQRWRQSSLQDFFRRKNENSDGFVVSGLHDWQLSNLSWPELSCRALVRALAGLNIANKSQTDFAFYCSLPFPLPS